MPLQPSAEWYARLAQAPVVRPVYVLVADGAPARWSSALPRARADGAIAEQINFSTAAAGHLVYQYANLPGGGTTAGRTFVGSIWLRAGTLSRARIIVGDGTNPATTQNVDLGADWRKFQVVFSAPGGAATQATLQIGNQGTDSGTIFATKAQLEERTGVDALSTFYEKTTTAAGRKNFLVRSEELDNASWSKSSGSVIVTANAAAGPASEFDAQPLYPLIAGALEVGSFSGSQIYPGEGRYALGDLQCRITDTGGLMTYWLGTERTGAPSWFLQPVTLYLGGADMTEDIYVPVWSGYVSDIDFDGSSYVLRGYNKLTTWDRPLMRNCASVDGSVKAQSATLPTTQCDGISDLRNEDGYFVNWKLKWTSGKNEGTEHTVTAYQTFSGTVRRLTLTPAAANAIAIDDGFTLYNYVVLVGNPINIWVRLLLGDFSLVGTVQTDWPLVSVSGVTPTGLSFKAADLDGVQIQAERDLWLRDHVFALGWTEPEQAKQTFQDQIFRLLQAYPTLSADGLFRIRVARPAAPAALLFKVSDDNIDGTPEWSRDTGAVINRVKVWGDYNLASRNFQLLADSPTFDARYLATALGFERLLEIKSRGLSSAQGASAITGTTIAEALIGRIAARFGTGGPETIEVEGGPILAWLEAGERVGVSFRDLPRLASGMKGKTDEVFEVVRVQVDGKTLRSRVQLAGFYPAFRPGFIAPDTVAADYASATDADKVYAYSCPNTGNFADGGQPYMVI